MKIIFGNLSDAVENELLLTKTRRHVQITFVFKNIFTLKKTNTFKQSESEFGINCLHMNLNYLFLSAVFTNKQNKMYH
jgi:hypothetical protein